MYNFGTPKNHLFTDTIVSPQSYTAAVVTGNVLNKLLIGSTVGVAAFLLITGIVLLIILFICCYFRTFQRKKKMVL